MTELPNFDLRTALKATRCLGNHYLKLPSIAVHSYEIEENYKAPFEKFHKAYVEHEPDVQVIDI